MKKPTSLVIAHALLLSLLAPPATTQQTGTEPPRIAPPAASPALPDDEDDTAGMGLEQLDEAQRNRPFQIFDTQGGLDYLSRQKGGFLIKNSNDLSRRVRRIVEAQRGYYLIGYRPEGMTFNRRYHDFTVKVRRPGLRVRTRTGFYGVRDEETRPAVRRTRDEPTVTDSARRDTAER